MPVAEPIAEAGSLPLVRLGQGDFVTDWAEPETEEPEADEGDGDDTDDAIEIPQARTPDRMGELARLSTWWTEVTGHRLSDALAILGVDSLDEVVDPTAARKQLDAALLMSTR